MPFKKGERTPGAGRPKGLVNRNTAEIKAVIQDMVNYIGENRETILDEVAASKPEVLVNFMARVAPKNLELSNPDGSLSQPFVVIQIPAMDEPK